MGGKGEGEVKSRRFRYRSRAIIFLVKGSLKEREATGNIETGGGICILKEGEKRPSFVY